MNAKQLERASYMAAHAVLSANISAPHLATPGARRSYTIDAIADQIRRVFELHCSAFDEAGDWASSAAFHAPVEESIQTTVPSSSSNNELHFAMQKLH